MQVAHILVVLYEGLVLSGVEKSIRIGLVCDHVNKYWYSLWRSNLFF